MEKEETYLILGVTEKVTLKELKTAYRLQAKKLHPDLNNSPNAHEEFVALGEAYEYLMNCLTGHVYHNTGKKYKWAKANRYTSYEAWAQQQRQYARERAAEHARMEYEAFKKTNFYKVVEVANVVMDAIRVITIAFIFVVFPVVFIIWKGWFIGIAMSTLIIFVTVTFWANFLRNFGLKKGEKDRF